MRPVRLEVRGFTAFREPAVVEFEGRRLFVITGPTGAGKSSLLDAMTWALFGQVPRVGRSVRELLAQGEREMSVLFEFTVRGQGYRVARRHPGTTSTRLERLVADQWVPVADRATDVTREVERILGMDFATFTRAILLPQGQFDSFLRGDAKDRRGILSQLIGLGVYQKAGEIARARAGRHRTEAEAITKQLEQLAFATPEVLGELQRREHALTEEQQRVQARRDVLQALGETARLEHEQRQARERAEADLREAEAEVAATAAALADAARALDQQREAVERAAAERDALAYDRAEHDRLQAAVALLDQRAAAEAALTAAQEEARAATTAEQHAKAVQAASRDALEAAERALKAATTAEQKTSDALARAAGRARRTRARIEGDVATLERDGAAAEESVRSAEQRVRDLEVVTQSLAAADADLDRAAGTLARAEAERNDRLVALEEVQATRAAAEGIAQGASDALDRARREDAAAHLRSGLAVGDVCPVCGETIIALAEHAAPDLARAEAAVEEATRTLTDARAAAERAAAALAATDARVVEGQRAHEAARSNRDALGLRLAELGTTPERVAKDTEAARGEVAAQATLMALKREEARALVEADQALREALARVPSGIEVVEAKRAPADPAATIEELAVAVTEHVAAAEGSRAAAQRHERLAGEARAATNAAAVATRDVERAQRGVAEAEQRLTTLGAVEGDAAEVRASLARVEDLAGRREQLDASLRLAREALASKEAARQAAEQAAARAAEQQRRRQAACAEAAAGHQAARAALIEGWRGVIDDPEPSLRALKTAMEACEADRVRVATEVERVRGEAERAAAQIEQAGRMRSEVREHQEIADLVGAVGTDLRGDRFIAFLLHESMQMLATDASERLGQFTNGRYALLAREDEFVVVDHLNGDEERSVKTLSGGETFLASLALALSLSEHLPEISGTGGAISLDSLFLDEGFGALDAEALDLAVQGLETLAEGSRMIGVISHVEELAERLPDRIRVEKGGHGSTVAA